jgi:hypothetical protein
MTAVALIPYRPQLPAIALDHVQRLGAAILRTLDRLGVRNGQAGVIFERVRLHRGEFLSLTIDTHTLSAHDQEALLHYSTVERLEATVCRPVRTARENDAILIVIDLRERPRTWRGRLAQLWKPLRFLNGGRKS